MIKTKNKNKRFGTCRICGDLGKLTYEHVPPRAAINDFRQKEYEYFQGNELINNKESGHKSKQKGSGDYYLCPRCNNDTGAYYGDAFQMWARQIFTAVYEDQKEEGNLKFKIYKFYPLRVLKQIISMFLCISKMTEDASPDAKRKREKLKKFILDKEDKNLPNEINIYLYGHSPYSTLTRQIPIAMIADPLETLEEFTGKEISMYGAGYIFTENKNINELKIIEADNLINITFFKTYSYDDEIELELKIPILPNHTLNLCDFRVKSQITNIMPKNHVILSDLKSIKGLRPK